MNFAGDILSEKDTEILIYTGRLKKNTIDRKSSGGLVRGTREARAFIFAGVKYHVRQL